jgi:hypothetical protein
MEPRPPAGAPSQGQPEPVQAAVTSCVPPAAMWAASLRMEVPFNLDHQSVEKDHWIQRLQGPSLPGQHLSATWSVILEIVSWTALCRCSLETVFGGSFAVGGPSGGLRVGLFPSDAVGIDQFLASFELLESDGLCPVGSRLPHGHGRR